MTPPLVPWAPRAPVFKRLVTIGTVAFAVLVGWAPSRAHAVGLVCEELQGTFRIVPDPSCQIVSHRLRSWVFPDVVFVAELGVPDTCFTGVTVAELGGASVLGTSQLAQIVHQLPAVPGARQPSAAAHAFVVERGGVTLGSLFFRHFALVDPSIPDVEEEVVVVAGSGAFLGAKGTVRLSGNPFAGARLLGTICSLAVTR